MEKDIPYAIVLPATYETESTKTFPVLYCLHGYGAPYDTWAVMSPLLSAIDGDYPAIIVTFEGSTSWYIDHPSDPSIQYTRFFFEELVPFVESTYRAGRSPSMRGVTGFSMGGFGAWHYMLERPDFFASVSALSGAFDRIPNGEGALNPYGRITDRAGTLGTLPPIYMNCGTADSLLSDNRNMAAHLTALGYSNTLIETSGAGHDWPFWRDTSDELLAWHYASFSEPPITWRGFPLTDGVTAETDAFGSIFVLYDPWVYIFATQSWMYIHGDWKNEDSRLKGWFYVSDGN